MFQFVPRKVAQKLPKPPPNGHTASSSAAASTSHVAQVPDEETHHQNSKGKGKATDTSLKDEDLAALLCLALSDHSLWLNVDLRRAVATAEDGWTPLSYLLHHSSYFSHVNVKPSEATLVRAIREHAHDILEVRMLVPAPSKSAWYGKGASQDADEGGFEVRRKRWEDALSRVRNSARGDWEMRTVYMESIPLQYRSMPGIFHFATLLLSESATTTRIQGITLPPHHLDRPGDIPKCKGFALVTFSAAEDATRLVEEWPWLPRRTSASSDGTNEAVKFGFRTLAKARWDALKEEYLMYRQRLLAGMAEAESLHAPPRYAEDDHHVISVVEEASSPVASSSLDPYAPFPPGCLVFVRNVHPETNKTTLKTLFTVHAFGNSSVSSAPSALDYVDYNKGMTSCYLRVSTPDNAQTLISAFSSRPVVQCKGLDSKGSESSTPLPPSASISVELVDGERETLYWNKVPEKVRREAVRKAIAQSVSGNCEDPVSRDDVEDEGERLQGKRPRKRRRKA